MSKYTIEYFIEKFEEMLDHIPWIGEQEMDELDKLLSVKIEWLNYFNCYALWSFCYWIAPTPKQRILTVLEVERDLRDWRKL